MEYKEEDFINIIKWSVIGQVGGAVGVAIKGKVEMIYQNFNIEADEVIYDIVYDFYRLNHKEKYDTEKSALTTWLPVYVNHRLSDLIKKYRRYGANINFRKGFPEALDWNKKVSLFDLARKNDEIKELSFDGMLEYHFKNSYETTPEDIMISKETVELASKVFSQRDLLYLFGEVGLEERLNELNISNTVYQNKLRYKKLLFKALYEQTAN